MAQVKAALERRRGPAHTMVDRTTSHITSGFSRGEQAHSIAEARGGVKCGGSLLWHLVARHARHHLHEPRATLVSDAPSPKPATIQPIAHTAAFGWRHGGTRAAAAGSSRARRWPAYQAGALARQRLAQELGQVAQIPRKVRSLVLDGIHNVIKDGGPGSEAAGASLRRRHGLARDHDVELGAAEGEEADEVGAIFVAALGRVVRLEGRPLALLENYGEHVMLRVVVGEVALLHQPPHQQLLEPPWPTVAL
jgi:hypothetical protein